MNNLAQAPCGALLANPLPFHHRKPGSNKECLMNAFWKILSLTVLLAHCKVVERPTMPVKKASTTTQVSPFFIVNEERVSSSMEAQSLCPVSCEEQGASWTGTWSDRSPFPHTAGGVCECRDKALTGTQPIGASIPSADKSQTIVEIYQMSEEEMMESFEVEAKADAGTASATAKADAEEGSKAVAKAGDSVSKAESRPDVSATVKIDEEKGQVTATAKAGKAVARAKTPPADGATTSINKKTGTVKACAQAGEARACAVSQKDPFDI
jgi:hypothetical protein